MENDFKNTKDPDTNQVDMADLMFRLAAIRREVETSSNEMVVPKKAIKYLVVVFLGLILTILITGNNSCGLY